MSTYAIGDVQGCLYALEKLLDKIKFDSSKDQLWFTGDLVNRGPQSLETLRFIKSLGQHQQIVLGNHDLHLLAMAHGAHTGWKEDTLQSIFTAPDKEEIINWLLQQPLLYHDAKRNTVMVHAGVSPDWDLMTAKSLANEVEAILRSEQREEFFNHMYGNEPNRWDAKLQGWDRYRCITNYFTRARFCYADGSLDLESKESSVAAKDSELVPWFQFPNRKMADVTIIFGHWAALGGVTNTPNAFALDTGCVWGYCLTAMCLEDGERVSVDCK